MSKIAIPTRDGQVDEHFGHCQSFTVFTLAEDRSLAGRESFVPPPACGCKSNLAARLKDMGVGVLIAGNMGQGAAEKLLGLGIQVVRGAAGPVEEALHAFLNGSLKDNALLCQAHEHGHTCLH
jgi:predicted Fe-Mo cluster-binding NifX family protein